MRGKASPVLGLQYLRAVAAIMVVFHHARHSVPAAEGWTEFGSAGVDIFFVISGFVMALTSRDPEDESWTRRVRASKEFLVKRIVRVVPLYWIALLWTSRRDILTGSDLNLLALDFLFIPRPNPTYPDMLWPSLLQGWTLNYEMYFYSIFSISLLARKIRLSILMCMLTGILIICQLLVGGTQFLPEGTARDMATFYGNDIVFEFLLGVLLYKLGITHSSPQHPRYFYFLTLTAGFLLLYIGHSTGPRFMTQGLPATLIVWSAIPAFSGRESALWKRLGDASYSIYLFHWASFGISKPVAAFVTSDVQGHLSSITLTVFFLITLIASGIAAGIAVHALVEKPIIRIISNLHSVKPRIY